ncbi:MAG: SUMF1/EgtB/PvdO family nonheme iron enzyme [Ardenticatenaceae bacterium]|nr:SUMF1/EgtB/PvdO family nonheme iron enzyme [Ardenticatenaceae bacterium]
MRLSTPLFNALVRALAPLLRDRDERDRLLDLAFHGEPALYDGLAPEADSPQQYAWTLVRYLEPARTGDEQWALPVYVETVRDDLGGDRAATLAGYVAQLQAYEAAHAALRQAGLDPNAATLDEIIAVSLDDLRLAFAADVDRYVDLGGTRRTYPAPPIRARARGWVDPLADLGIDIGHVELDGVHCRDGEATAVPVENVREALLRAERAVLLGEPGSGKTFTLWRLALDYAAIWHGGRPDPRPDRAVPLVPVLVKLNEFNGQTPDDRPLAFTDFALSHLGLLVPFLPQLRPRLVWLLDALNEMPRRAPSGRDLVAEVRAFLAGAPAFVLSCRVRDYRDDLALLRPLEQLSLRDLTPPQIRKVLVRRLPDGEVLWQAIGGREALLNFWEELVAHGEAERFWEAGAGRPEYAPWGEYFAWRAIHAGARLIPLCRNPFMAYLLCEFYGLEGQLPASRADLFARFVRVLLQREAAYAARRGEPWPASDRVEAALVAVATAMQRGEGTVLPRAAAASAAAQTDGEALLNAALAASLLVEEGDAVRFSHQLFQEFFAARTLLAAMERGEPAGQFFGAEWWEAGAWRETTVMAGEFLGEGAAGPNRVACWLAPASPEVALQAILRNGAGLTPADVEPATRAALVASARTRTGEPDPRGRAAAFRVLGRLEADDPPGVGLRADGLPDIVWVKLPGGRFPIGGDEQAYDSLPAGEVELAALWMAKYPITNRQFQAFIEAADGYHQGEWWQGLAQPEWDPFKPAFPYGNYPREGVNGYEAVAFCRWLSARLGYEVRLPREQEWERAARGRKGAFSRGGLSTSAGMPILMRRGQRWPLLSQADECSGDLPAGGDAGGGGGASGERVGVDADGMGEWAERRAHQPGGAGGARRLVALRSSARARGLSPQVPPRRPQRPHRFSGRFPGPWPL